MPAKLAGRGFEPRRIRQLDGRSQLSPTQAAQHKIGSWAGGLALPQKRRCLRHLANRIDAVGRFRGRFYGDQNAGAHRTLSFRLRIPSGRVSRGRDDFYRIGFFLALFLKKAVDQMAACNQGCLKCAKRGSVVSELLVTGFLQLSERQEAGVKILLGLSVEFLRSLFKSFIEYLGSELALFDQSGALLLGVVTLCLVFISHFARLLVIEQVVGNLLYYRDKLQRDLQLGSDKPQRRPPRLRVAIFQFRIYRVPELIDEAITQRQTILQSREALALEERLRQPGGKLQIFGLVGEQVGGEFDDQQVVRNLAVTLGHPGWRLIFLAPRFLDFVVNRIVAQVGAAGIRPLNRVQ